ncbi:UDP-glucose--hexose-1-phosphate uridylyltransferase [Tepidibacillus sp. LV47]|uniref:UDP-glucose--hexose-1-phosphate uridylyltransferase n=1 Tax=Tepidibacillus sp. LV47 TaxID=3398228 RepID=UPI003AB0E8F7
MNINIYEQVERLIQYGLKKNLIAKWDIEDARNKILEVLQLQEWEETQVPNEELAFPTPILEKILDWAGKNGRLEEDAITYRDLFDTKIMGCLMPRPSEVVRNFYEKYEKSPEQATNYFYQLSQDCNYIRIDRIAKNEHWLTETEYGNLEITINLSKPEKDPKSIAAAQNMKQSSYPKCLLCKENVGYAGRVNHPARQNHRIIPLELNNERWYLQYSPYVYYNEHCIVLSDEHRPMKISRETFARLLEFVEKYPHYFLGSNADLPIVGGSILSHDHFQGGRHEFPMAKASIEKEFTLPQFPNVKAGIVKWPMSVIRIQSENWHDLVELADKILHQWKRYSDESVGILAFTGDTPHNTITPIARKRGKDFELDLVLRNNRTSKEHPLGVFHPHQEVHHIKKENIGLIEVMGLAVLPGRLKGELKQLAEALVKENYIEEIKKNEDIVKHLEWAIELKQKYPELNEGNSLTILRQEVGFVFTKILGHAGVFKRDQKGKEAFVRFIKTL